MARGVHSRMCPPSLKIGLDLCLSLWFFFIVFLVHPSHPQRSLASVRLVLSSPFQASVFFRLVFWFTLTIFGLFLARK